MKNEKNCIYCGQRLTEDARFCPLCGKPQETLFEEPIPKEPIAKGFPADISEPSETDLSKEKDMLVEKEPVPDIATDSSEQKKEQIAAENTSNTSPSEVGTKIQDAAKTATSELFKKAKDANIPGMAKNAAKSVRNGIEQAAKQPKKSKPKSGKRTARLFETETLNNEEAARELYERNSSKLKRCQLGLIIAAVASMIGAPSLASQFELITLPSFIQSIIDMLLFPAIIGAIISYILAGGILTAIKYSFRIAEFGWFIIPIFPIDLCVGFVALMISIAAFIYAPIISVGINYIQTKKNIEQAELFFGILR